MHKKCEHRGITGILLLLLAALQGTVQCVIADELPAITRHHDVVRQIICKQQLRTSVTPVRFGTLDVQAGFPSPHANICAASLESTVGSPVRSSPVHVDLLV